MIIVLLENKVYAIESLIGKIKSEFPKSSILEVNRSNRFEMLKLSETTPLLTDGWIILCSERLNILQILPFTKNSKNLVVINATNTSKSDIINCLEDNKLEFSLVDNINVSKETLIKYVSNTLSLSEKDSKTLCNKCNNYLPYVLESVTLLQTLGRDVTRNDVLKFIDKRTTLNVHSLFLHLIGYRVLEETLVSTYLYDFKYAFSYMKTKLLAYLDDSIYIYTLIESGLLGGDNYKTYQYDKKLTISDYTLKNLVLYVHKEISFEVLLLTKIKVSKCTSMYMLLEFM